MAGSLAFVSSSTKSHLCNGSILEAWASVRSQECDILTMSGLTRLFEGVRKGLDHLHSLSIVHNDLNPSKIMLDDEDVPRIIDFGSCTSIGQSLKGVGHIYECYDDRVQMASKSNDLDALAEIHAWMNGEASRFRFSE